MKLRLRSLESKQTLKIEVPDPCTLSHLKQTLSQSLPSPLSSSSIHLSLNRKDELHAASPQDSLRSLGVASGDLVFFTLNPLEFSRRETQVLNPSVRREPVSVGPSDMALPESATIVQEMSLQAPISEESETLAPNCPSQETLDLKSPIKENSIPEMNVQEQSDGSESVDSDMSDVVGEENVSDSTTQKDETSAQYFEGSETMDVDVDGSVVFGKKFSEPSFLRRVLREELGDDGSDHKLLVIAVHAVLLESGFVGFDPVSGMRMDRFHLPDEWPSMAFTMSLWYTLPELLDNSPADSNVTETVVLKFSSLGQFVNVYGCLANHGGSGPYRVCLNEYRFAPTIDLVWANCDMNDKINVNDSSGDSYPENEVFEFWKIVKDGLALPLLIDLCEKTSLSLPPCLMRLPTELKLKIMESLPGNDIAKVGCVCSELRYLSSNNDLWKQKFAEEFGGGIGSQGSLPWKERFTSLWESRKKRKRENSIWRGFAHVDRPFAFSNRRNPVPFGIPPMIGGDYDHLPGLGVPSPFGHLRQAIPRALPQFQLRRRNFTPHCNLGGFNG